MDQPNKYPVSYKKLAILCFKSTYMKWIALIAIFLLIMIPPFSAFAILHGDIDNSGSIDLKDAIVALQLFTKINVTIPVYVSADVNGDGKIGIAEVIYILQSVSELRSGPFVSGDLHGIWYYQGVVSGNAASGQLPGWVYGSMTVDNSGNATATPIVDSAGTAPYTPIIGKVSIDERGVITPTPGGTGRWLMTLNKQMMILVTAGSLGSITGVRGYNLIIFTKAGSNFSTSDLEGTWNFHSLASGDTASGQLPGWVYGSRTFDGEGNIITSTPVVDSAGTAPFNPGGGTESIDSNGMITPVLGGTGRWIMTQSKDTMVMVGTGALGSITGVHGYNLAIGNKAGSNFSSADLQGTWNFHILTSGGDSSQYMGWGYGSASIDGSGTGTWSSMTRSNGVSTLPPGGQFGIPINSNGVIMPSSTFPFHAVMSLGRDTIIGTMDDGGGGYDLIIFSRTVPAVASDFVGTWKGTANFSASDGESGTYATTMTLSNNNGTLAGTIRNDTDTYSISGTVTSGIFSFSMPNSDPANPNCANWNVPVTAILDSSMHTMRVYASGTFCGQGGGKPGIFSAILTKQLVVGTWQTSNYPQSDSGQFIFNADGSFSSVFYETTTTTSSGSYTYSNNTLALHYIQTSNSNLVGTTETFNNVTLSGNQLSVNGTTFILTKQPVFAGTYNFSEQYDLNISNGVALGLGSGIFKVTQIDANNLNLQGTTTNPDEGTGSFQFPLVLSDGKATLPTHPYDAGDFNLLELLLLSDGNNMVYTGIGQEYNNPSDISLTVANWLRNPEPATIDAFVGTWKGNYYYDNNLRTASGAFNVSSASITISKVDADTISVTMEGHEPSLLNVVNGRATLANAPVTGASAVYHAASMVTDGSGLSWYTVATELSDPTDVSIMIGLMTKQ